MCILSHLGSPDCTRHQRWRVFYQILKQFCFSSETHPEARCFCFCFMLTAYQMFLSRNGAAFKTFCQCVAACSQSDAWGILTNLVDDPLCFKLNYKVGRSIELSLDNVLLWTRGLTYGNESLFLVVLQGSYGVVKLAYNEDDDKHYVSQRSLLSEMQSLHHTATKELYSISAMLLIFIFQSHPLKLHHLPWKKQEGLLLLLKVHPRLYYLSSKQCCFVYIR